MATTNNKDDMTARGYKVDLWDALLILEMLPVVRSGSRYAQASRLALYDLYDSIRGMINADPNVEYEGGPSYAWKNQLTGMCRDKSLFWVHQLAVSPFDQTVTEGQKEEMQAFIDFYSTVHDKFREEL